MRVLVLGAGIQGVCAALALRQRGHHITLIDRMPDLMLRTSLRNEGKIHLGFVYANDASFQTSALLLRAALKFSPLLDEWLEMQVDWRSMTSTPFVYLVARDSMLSAEKLYAHYARLQDDFNEITEAGHDAFYLGNDLRGKVLWKRADPKIDRWFSAKHAADCIETVELALDREKFRTLLRARLASFPEIETRFGHSIETLERTAHGFRVQGTRADGTPWHASAETVVNCLWDGRLVFDQQLGIAPACAFVMRLKYRVVGELAPAFAGLPSFTMVLGRYGDIVVYPNAPSYFSWYPACMRGWSQTIAPPVEWDAACVGNAPREISEHVARETLAAFDEIVPGIKSSRVGLVDAGVIYSRGATDIDDYASALHRRYEIGFSAHDGYYSVDTGKFTCAPFFAEQLALQMG